MLQEIWQDLRFGARTFVKSPILTAAAILTLALGLGAITAVYTVVSAVLFSPLPYDEPDELVLLWHRMVNADSRKARISAPDVVDYQEQSRLFEGFAFLGRTLDSSLVDRGEAVHVKLSETSTNIFSVLGVPPFLGRSFEPGEGVIPAEILEADDDADVEIPPGSAILSYGLWQHQFGKDPSILGQSVELDGLTYVIIGVMPEGFELLLPPDAGIATDADLWASLRFELDGLQRDEGRSRDQDSDNTGAIIARLKPGVSRAQAQTEMNAIATRQREEIPYYRDAGMQIDVYAMHQDLTRHARPALLALLGAVGIMLLIACLNVASLLLARASQRQRELALRTALGATRFRLVRQVLTESTLLALFGCGLGLLLARVGTDLLLALSPPDLPRLQDVGIDGQVLAFTLAVTVLTTLLVGTVPALSSSLGKSSEVLKQGLRSSPPGRTRVRSSLVIAEIALSLVLLVGSGLMLRSFLLLQRVAPGFDSGGTLTFNMTLRGQERFRGPADRARFIHELEAELSAVPGVEAIGATGLLPLSGGTWTQPYSFRGQDEEARAKNEANFRMITSGYFSAMGTRLLAGRFFTEEEDLFENERVVIIDEKLAARRESDDSPIGGMLGFPLDGSWTWARVVGVVEHTRHETLRQDSRETLYVPYRQEASRQVTVAIKGSQNPVTLIEPVRQSARALEPQLLVYQFRTMESYVSDSMAATRFALALIAVFAAVALILASVGLYGLISYLVQQRRREMGIRLALGARPGDLIGSILRRGAVLVAIGLVVGFVVSLAATRALSSLLYGVPSTDLVTYAIVSAILAAVALLACYLPGRRASRIKPMDILKAE